MLDRLPTNRFVRHLLFWLGVCLFLMGIDIADVRFHANDQSFYLASFFGVLLPVLLINAYVLAYRLMPLALNRQFGRFAGGLLMLLFLMWVLYNTLAGIVLGLIIPVLTHKSKAFIIQAITNRQIFDLAYLNGAVFTVNLVASFFVGIRLFSQWYQKQQESQRLEYQKLQTELQLLKLQLNPAFLFGSLHTLYQLTQSQSKQAPEVVLKLAHLLRYILYESQSERVPLAGEIDMIAHYVFLQRTMHPDQVEVSFTVRGNSEPHSIVALSLIPIVENAFSELPAQLDESTWVTIDLAISETQVHLKVINELTNSTQADTKQTNLDGVRKLLAFYYPDSHHVQIWQEDRINVVTLTLSFPTNHLKAQSLSTL